MKTSQRKNKQARTVYNRSMHYKTRILGIALLIPSLFFILLTLIIPIIWNFLLSFTKWNAFSPVEFIGIDNYIKVFRDSITIKSFYYSIFIAFVSAALALLLGILLALMIYKSGRKEGAAYRLVFFAPSMMPFVVIGLLFTFILSPDMGLLNSLLRLIGLSSLERAWLGEPSTVLWTVSVVSGWRFSGMVMMLVFTAILAIPASMFEAARLEGLNYYQQVKIIIFPLIIPTIRLVSMLMLIYCFRTYDVVMAMTKGGPGDFSRTAPVRMLDVAFKHNEFGYAAAISVVLTLLVSVFIFVSQKFSRSEVYEY